jgi:hypothetical protein
LLDEEEEYQELPGSLADLTLWLWRHFGARGTDVLACYHKKNTRLLVINCPGEQFGLMKISSKEGYFQAMMLHNRRFWE